ncbi:hypothetical protein LCGC14_2890170 [marine sediment metagenome]|uniref:Uncharacterized protein n=1 Tax=marine sediment metagenome TaxID=412755 RepID=A0A0F8XXG5_9ZZZZ
MKNKMLRIEWKKNLKKKGKQQRQRIKEWNCALVVGTSPKKYTVDNPKTIGEIRNEK